MVKHKNSTDLSSGRRPTSKSVETFGVTTLVTKLQTSEKVEFGQKWFSYWEFDPSETERAPEQKAFVIGV